jgi:ABC-type lipoprotein export system ATPase subunit
MSAKDGNTLGSTGNGPLILCENLVKIYKTGDIEVVALQGLDLRINHGELMAVVGNSGSGKSSLLNILGGLDKPSAGTVLVDGEDILAYGDDDLVLYRREKIGFVWQNSARNLIPYLTARQNVELPMRLTGKADRGFALELLEMVGLTHKRNSVLEELSGGEQQRVAVALAFANRPRLILADEPTGSVDSETADRILDVFRRFNEHYGVTEILVTHDRELRRKVDRVVEIRDGRTSSEYVRKLDYRSELAALGDTIDSGEDESHEKFAVADRHGRIQIPEEYMDILGLKGRGKLRVEKADGGIMIRPAEAPPDKEKDDEQGPGIS